LFILFGNVVKDTLGYLYVLLLDFKALQGTLEVVSQLFFLDEQLIFSLFVIQLGGLQGQFGLFDGHRILPTGKQGDIGCQ